MSDPKLNDVDRIVLRELNEGRNVPKNLADEAGKSRQYVHQRLKILKAADYVENKGNGVYELQPEELPEDEREELGIDDSPSDAVKSAAIAQATLRETERELAECQREREELRGRVKALENQSESDAGDLEGGRALDALVAAHGAITAVLSGVPERDEEIRPDLKRAANEIDVALEVLEDGDE